MLPTPSERKLETIGSPETTVNIYYATRYHIPEDCNLKVTISELAY